MAPKKYVNEKAEAAKERKAAAKVSSTQMGTAWQSAVAAHPQTACCGVLSAWASPQVLGRSLVAAVVESRGMLVGQ